MKPAFAVVLIPALLLLSGCAVRRDCFVGSYTGDRLCRTRDGKLTFEMNKNFPHNTSARPKY
jgi:hypothetical protein